MLRPTPSDTRPTRSGSTTRAEVGTEPVVHSGNPLRIGLGLAGLQFGGCQINALDLAQELDRRGHEVVTFAVQDNPLISVAPLAEKMGIALHILPAEDTVFLQARRIADFTAKYQFDVIHVFGAWLAPPTALALRSSATTALVVTNWTMENIRGMPPMTPLLLGTEALRDEAARSVRKAPVWLLEPPVDTRADQHSTAARAEFRGRWSIEADTSLVVIVSRLDHDMKAEGIARAIRTMRVIADPSLQLAIVGGGDAESLLAELATEVNDALGWRAVLLTGPMQDPSPAYSAADLVLAMGGAALRALAFERPLVVLGEDGFSLPFTPGTLEYFLRNGYYGRGCAGDPAVALGEHIVSTLALAGSSELAGWGRQVLLSRYSLTTVSDRLLTIYDAALRQTSRLRHEVDAAYVAARHHARRLRHAFTHSSSGRRTDR